MDKLSERLDKLANHVSTRDAETIREAAAIVRAWEGAAVVQCEYDDDAQETRVIGMSDMCWNGQRVRIVPEAGR